MEIKFKTTGIYDRSMLRKIIKNLGLRITRTAHHRKVPSIFKRIKYKLNLK